MGITLIGGFILLFALIIKKENSKPEASTSSYSVASTSAEYKTENCVGGELNIEENGVIENVMLDNQRLIMLISGVKDDESQKIVIVDRCENKIINRIILNRKPVEKAAAEQLIN